MAVSSTSTYALSRHINSPPAASLPFLRLSSYRPSPVRFRGLSAVHPRRSIPRIEAKQQTFSSFEQLIEESDKPLLVDFYATWCGPCQFMVPVLEEVSEKLREKIQVIKIDTEKYTKIANKYEIEALPTFIIFKDGKPCDRFEGALTADKLIERVESVINVS